MMRLHHSLFLFLLVCVTQLIETSAWGTLGHEIVANLAWMRLRPETKEWVQSLLKHVEPEDDMSPLAKVADWADEIRHFMGWSASLHFIDIRDDLVDGGCERLSEKCDFQYKRDCPADFCVAGAILNYTDQLLLPSNSGNLRSSPSAVSLKVNQTQALMFLTHFVGDIHQPLHVSRQTDKGGNDFHVHFSLTEPGLLSKKHHHHKSWNLHSVWDSGIIDVVLERNYENSRQEMEKDLYKDMLANQDTQKLTCPSGMNATCIVEWGKGSWDLAIQYAYVLSDNTTQVENGSILDERYYESRLPMVKQQLVLAGYRLATTLEDIAKHHSQKGVSRLSEEMK